MTSVKMQEEKSTSLGDMILMMTQAMSLLNKIDVKKGVSKDDLLECEFVLKKFKQDFGEELLVN